MSRHSIDCHFDINASSQIMIFAVYKSLVNPYCLLTLQIFESSILSRILNLVCVVCPLSKINATTLDDVVAKAVKLLDLIVARIARYKYIFPLPLGPSMRNVVGSLLIFFKISYHMHIFV